ncbi:Uncharacterised protein [uncultured archaeon]|nr:Uncharacterised protein [uncultured archaeon]
MRKEPQFCMAEEKFNFAAVDAAFQTYCRIMFGRPVGGLLEFEPYLREAMLPYAIMKSCVSGKDVYMSGPHYPKGGRFAGPGELAQVKQPPVSINDIKDADSLFRAAGEQFVYCGNKVFGRNINTALVDNSINCIDVYYSHNVRNVKKAAYVSCVRESEYVFGIPAFPKINYSMRCLEGINVNRMFETYYSNHCSDMYYSFNCYNCSEVIFGFNLRGRRHVIGNVQLDAARYSELKKKLASEIAEELSKRKRAFSISDMARMGVSERKGGDEYELIPTVPAPASVEKAFSETAKIVLGVERSGISQYAPFLQKRALPVKKLRGKYGSAVYRPETPLVNTLPAGILCTREEAMAEDKPLVGEKELALPLRELASAVAKKASITLEMVEGETREVPEITQAIDSTECWSSWDATSSTRSACSTGIIQSKYIFGGYFRMLDSEFCINCYDMVEAKRCFELDSSSKAIGCYFCHNVEGCEECIFCCNAKGLRHAVFNQQLPKGEYLRVKKMLLDYVNAELDRGKTIGQSVFSLVK